MNSTMKKILGAKKSSSLASVLSQSKFIEKDILCDSGVPILNIGLSGQVDGGITSGVTQLVGQSRTFKTNFGLANVAAFMEAKPESICIFCDSELGANLKYWEAFNIDMDRVLHLPIKHVEELQHQLMYYLEEVLKEDDVNDPKHEIIIFIDSVAQLPSKKEYADSVEQNSTKDMTRAASLNSFWRCITPIVSFRNIPLFWINGFYEDMGNKYADPILKGGQQGFLSSNNIWFITRSQEKDKDKELIGWNFNIKVMKGRFTKEKLKLPVTVLYNGGIDRWSGLLPICQRLGFIEANGAWYRRTEASGIPDTKKRMSKDMDDAFWMALLEQPQVVDAINEYVGISNSPMLDPIEEEALDNEIKGDSSTS